jgi:hypothetical protein
MYLFLCTGIREKCCQSLEFTGKCIRKFLYFGSQNQDGFRASARPISLFASKLAKPYCQLAKYTGH